MSRRFRVVTDWDEMTPEEREANFDAAMPAILLAWLRAGDLEVESEDEKSEHEGLESKEAS